MGNRCIESEAENYRVARIKSDLSEMQGVIDDREPRSSELVRERLSEVIAEEITEARFAEFTATASDLKDKAIAALEAKLEESERREEEAEDLMRLRDEMLERLMERVKNESE